MKMQYLLMSFIKAKNEFTIAKKKYDNKKIKMNLLILKKYMKY